MDIADQAEAVSEIIKMSQLQHAHRAVPDAVATGECLFCGEPLPPHLRWCGAECRDDWKREAAS